jgi:hypothetical protein
MTFKTLIMGGGGRIIYRPEVSKPSSSNMLNSAGFLKVFSNRFLEVKRSHELTQTQ